MRRAQAIIEAESLRCPLRRYAPVMRITRVITPRFVRDEHIPFAAFLLLLWLWIGLAMAKRYVCLSQGLDCSAI